MEKKKLYELLQNKDLDYQEWQTIKDFCINEKTKEYQSLSVQEAIPRWISDYNLRERKNFASNQYTGVLIKVGDICYIDYGEAYIQEIGYQHFGLIISIYHYKAFIIPMSSNLQGYKIAYGKHNPQGKGHLLRLGKLKGMNKESTLFLNDAKFINTARIIDVKAHLDIDSTLFKEIKQRLFSCIFE